MRRGILVFGFLFGIFLIGFVSAEVRINEIELNPPGTDSGNEWIELYSDNEINMTNWTISSNNGRSITFNTTFSGYYIIITPTNLLTNTNNNLTLKNDNNVQIFSTGFLNDSDDDDRTWQYCSGNWSFRNSTSGATNNCTISTPAPTCTQNWSCSAWNSCSSSSQTRTCTDTNSCGNTTGKPAESQSCTMPIAEYIELNWTDEILNKDEFYIETDLFNLLSQNYDVKVWISFNNNDTVISEVYDTNDDSWKSGTYYITNFITGAGNKTKDVKLRLKEEYQDFEGDAQIFARLRYNGDVVDDYEKTIEISASDNVASSGSNQPASTTTNANVPLTAAATSSEGDIIVLGSSSAKTTEKTANSIIYKSKMEYIKDYAPYLLCLVCIFIIILLMIEKKSRRNIQKAD